MADNRFVPVDISRVLALFDSLPTHVLILRDPSSAASGADNFGFTGNSDC